MKKQKKEVKVKNQKNEPIIFTKNLAWYFFSYWNDAAYTKEGAEVFKEMFYRFENKKDLYE